MAGVTHDEWMTWTDEEREAFALAMTREELNENSLFGRRRRNAVRRYHCAALGYGPEGERRAPIPWGVKRLVAQKQGAIPGQVSVVECPRCGAKGEVHWQRRTPRFIGLHIDHIRPVSRGGGNGPENLRLLCPHCNISRGNREVA